MNYRGYFQSDDRKSYVVMLNADSGETFTEVPLAGDPVVINYGSDSLIFSPTKISTCSVSILSSGYLEDLYTAYNHGVAVQVYCTTDQSIVWQGYLKPQIYSQTYESCLESTEFVCSDCLASLKYVDYKTVGERKQIVTFKDIIDQACTLAGVDGYYWDNSKLLESNIVLTPDKLTISEQNFYTKDTDEPWAYFTVLEEMCKYLGLTLFQWGSFFYFVDYQTFHANSSLTMYLYLKANDYAGEGTRTMDAPVTITEKKYRGTGHSISFEPLYKKATVKSNFYYPDYYIPDLDNTDKRTNRNGGSKCVEIPAHINTIQIKDNEFSGNTAYTPVYILKGKQKYDADDSKYVYYRRLMDHDNYESVYYTSGLTPTTPPDADLPTSRITRDYISGQLVEFGYADRGGDTTDASYELASSISFSKYLLIHQWDQPEFRWGSANIQNHVNDYPTIFKLKSGFTNPIIFGDDSYLCLFANAQFERYDDREYYNPDWTDEASLKGAWQTGTDANVRPYLNFKLGIGNKWWNGTGWTTTETSFWVKARTEASEDDASIPDGSNWNKDREILNNVPFTDWTGADGYKIPLDSTLDPNAEIKFFVNMPIKLAYINLANIDVTTGTSGQNHWCWLNNLALTIHNKLTEEKEESDIVYGGDDDGLIDANSMMELNEITCKFTTFPGDAPLSYSNVGLATGGFLSGLVEPCLIVSHVSQKPEENLLTKYINQYSSQTIKEELTVGLDILPFQKIYDEYWGNSKHFVWDGAQINLKEARQTITIVQTK